MNGSERSVENARVGCEAWILSSQCVEWSKGGCCPYGSSLRAGELRCAINVPEEGRVVVDEVETGWVASGGRVERVRGGKNNVVHLKVLERGYGDPCGDQVESPIVVTEGRGKYSILTCGCGCEIR